MPNALVSLIERVLIGRMVLAAGRYMAGVAHAPILRFVVLLVGGTREEVFRVSSANSND